MVLKVGQDRSLSLRLLESSNALSIKEKLGGNIYIYIILNHMDRGEWQDSFKAMRCCKLDF